MLRHENPKIQASLKDEVIFAMRSAAFEARECLLGHYVLVNGLYDRITHQWDDTVQANGIGGSYYLADNSVSYSGGCSPGYDIGDLELTDKTVPGDFWFFHDDQQRAANAVRCLVDCRVYKVRGE